MPRGRPKKYNEECTLVAFRIPISIKEKLEEIAERYGVSMTDVFITSVVAEDNELRDAFLKRLNTITTLLYELKQENKRLAEMNEKLLKEFDKGITVKLFEKIEIPEEIKRFVEERRQEIIQISRTGSIEALADRYTSEIENNMMVKGYVAKNRRLLKKVVKQAIAEVLA